MVISTAMTISTTTTTVSAMTIPYASSKKLRELKVRLFWFQDECPGNLKLWSFQGAKKKKKRQTKFQQHHYLQTATNIYHQNMEGGKVRALTSHNFVKAKLFPFLYSHTHWGAGLESAAGRGSAVSTQRECGSFENIKQWATKPKCHLAFWL